jgi:hypothetical protein
MSMCVYVCVFLSQLLICDIITVTLYQIADPLQLTSVTQKVRQAFHRQVKHSLNALSTDSEFSPSKVWKYLF